MCVRERKRREKGGRRGGGGQGGQQSNEVNHPFVLAPCLTCACARFKHCPGAKVASLHAEVQAWLMCKGPTCKPHGFNALRYTNNATRNRNVLLRPPVLSVPAGCVPKPHPTPPPPPKPSPPPPGPVPTGSHMFMHSGLCLTGVESANGHAAAVMAKCTSAPPLYNKLQVWDDTTPIQGQACIRSYVTNIAPLEIGYQKNLWSM